MPHGSPRQSGPTCWPTDPLTCSRTAPGHRPGAVPRPGGGWPPGRRERPRGRMAKRPANGPQTARHDCSYGPQRDGPVLGDLLDTRSRHAPAQLGSLPRTCLCKRGHCNAHACMHWKNGEERPRDGPPRALVHQDGPTAPGEATRTPDPSPVLPSLPPILHTGPATPGRLRLRPARRGYVLRYLYGPVRAAGTSLAPLATLARSGPPAAA